MTLFTIYKNDSNTFAYGYKRTNDKYFIQTLLLLVNEKPNVQKLVKHRVLLVMIILIDNL